MTNTESDQGPAIEINGISKTYRIWTSPVARMRGLCWQIASECTQVLPTFSRWCANRESKHFRPFEALAPLSLAVHRGESVGVIGRNGSGKSTLLQIVAGTLNASSGDLRRRGRVAALLELGSGFDRDFTGRENVYLNASVLGLPRHEIDKRLQSILDFAEIGDFIDQPVRTYSSGMTVRLAFAVSVHVNPDILIVDEALSVGDARFQLKCARAIDRFIEKGVTLLFVSHDANLIKRLCNRAILLHQGHLLYSGSPADVANLYTKLISVGAGDAKNISEDIAKLIAERPESAPVYRPAPRNTPEPAKAAPPPAPVILDQRAIPQASGKEFSYGSRLGEIEQVVVCGEDGKSRTEFDSGDPVTVKLNVRAGDDFPEPIYALTIKNAAGVEVYGTNTLYSKQIAPPIRSGERRRVTFKFPINLMNGSYFLSFGFVHFFGDELVVMHRRYDAIKLNVHVRDRCFGVANLHATIQVEPL